MVPSFQAFLLLVLQQVPPTSLRRTKHGLESHAGRHWKGHALLLEKSRVVMVKRDLKLLSNTETIVGVLKQD